MNHSSEITHSLHGFEEVYAKYRMYFVRIAVSYVRDKMAAEDIVTDSFMVFWEKRHELDTRNIPAYLYSVVSINAGIGCATGSNISGYIIISNKQNYES